VSEQQRCARIAGRQLQITNEETQLAEDAHKRERYALYYRSNVPIKSVPPKKQVSFYSEISRRMT